MKLVCYVEHAQYGHLSDGHMRTSRLLSYITRDHYELNNVMNFKNLLSLASIILVLNFLRISQIFKFV